MRMCIKYGSFPVLIAAPEGGHCSVPGTFRAIPEGR